MILAHVTTNSELASAMYTLRPWGCAPVYTKLGESHTHKKIYGFNYYQNYLPLK